MVCELRWKVFNLLGIFGLFNISSMPLLIAIIAIMIITRIDFNFISHWAFIIFDYRSGTWQQGP